MTGPVPDPRSGPWPSRRSEPAINVPWPVMALIIVLIAAHAARVWLGLAPEAYALTAEHLRVGRWLGLLTHLFVHGSWAHVLMNSAFVLAFGTPVARFLRTGARGALAFLAFFLACGVIAGLAYAGLADALARMGFGEPDWAVVGASGAASGFMGAAARLIEGRGRLGAIGGRTVVAWTIAWVLVNALLGLTGLTPGTAGAPVAWQAHIFGFLAGLLLVGVFGRLAGLHEEMTQ